MPDKCDIGVTGLAVMGANLARNAARKGFSVAVHNRNAERASALVREHGHEGRFTAATDVAEFVASLGTPRAIIMMVKAGKPVDEVIAELQPHLERGDILIDGGNSLFSDTRRRGEALRPTGIRYIGMGVSGGEEGALEGPSMMPGGDREAYEHIAPMVTRMAAQVDGEPCCAYIGADGAGHYVKMVHNGIEYADMQLIAEIYDVLRSIYGMQSAAIADVFAEWKQGDLDSYLIEITAAVLRQPDDTAGRRVDAILDEAEQKGTGRWTSQSALELGVPVTAITEAVFARALSARRADRNAASGVLAGPKPQTMKPDAAALGELRDALYAAKIVAYAQGFEQMQAAAREFSWQLDLGEIASLWRGGCIIRAKFLDRIREAYKAGEAGNLLLKPYFSEAMGRTHDALRRVNTLAVAGGVPVPALSSSLAYYDGLRRARGPANLLQGLRDYFGAHTYRRLDREGVFHTRWAEDGVEVKL